MHNQALAEKVSEHFVNESFGPIRLNASLQTQWLTDLADYADSILSDTLELDAERNTRQDIKDFYRLLSRNPAQDHESGATDNGLCLWIHLIARRIQPETIVESGVWVGRSLYTLRQAVSSADVHAFDITFHKLSYRDPTITYHEYDWSESNVRCDGTGLCYFDDHINHGKRIREAYERGFRHLVFDDVAQLGTVHTYRYPALPSVLMIANDTLREGDVIEWTLDDHGKFRYTYRDEHTWGAEDLIDFVQPLPSLKNWIGDSTGQAAYVRLKN